MPINSKYTTEQVETVINELLGVLNKHQASTELCLMCLGNATSHIIEHNIPNANQAKVVESFNQALKDAIKS